MGTLCTGAVAASAVVVDHRFCNNNFTKKNKFCHTFECFKKSNISV